MRVDDELDLGALPIGEYAFPGPLRDRIVAAILDGDKTSTSSLAEEWRRDGAEFPRVGGLEVVIDSAGEAVCITRNITVTITRLANVPSEHAVAEGEGFDDVAAWRRAHEKFWTSDDYRAAVGEPPIAIDDDTEVVCVSFEVMHRF